MQKIYGRLFFEWVILGKSDGNVAKMLKIFQQKGLFVLIFEGCC